MLPCRGRSIEAGLTGAIVWDERERRMATRLATCACGELQAACSGDPVLVSLCHCTDCQRRTGSAFGIAAFFPREAVVTGGDARRYERVADSGLQVHFSFCPTCGSTVFWEPARKPDVVAVALGAFADPAFPSPTQEVYVNHRHLWVAPLRSRHRAPGAPADEPVAGSAQQRRARARLRRPP
jgi:hypothetical protein